MLNGELLTIVLVTYNHPYYVEYYLSKCDYLDKYGILLEVHDSSTNDETQKTVEEYKKKYNNLQYFRYDDINVDLKTYLSLSRVKSKYAFLCGDGVILNAESAYEKILSYMQRDFDVIELYDDVNEKHIRYYGELCQKYKCDEIAYDDLKSHMADNYWHMPYYGGTVVKSEIFGRITEEDIKPLIGTGFIYPYMICAYAGDNIKSVAIGGNYLIENTLKKGAIWLNSGAAIRIWAKQFPEVINMLPEKFDDIKQELILNSQRRLQFITFKGLCSFRANNNYSLKIYREYKSYLNKYSPCSKFLQVLIALTPKWIMKAVRKLYRGLK